MSITVSIDYNITGTNGGTAESTEFNPNLWLGNGGNNFTSSNFIWDGSKWILVMSGGSSPYPTGIVYEQDTGTSGNPRGNYTEQGGTDTAAVS